MVYGREKHGKWDQGHDNDKMKRGHEKSMEFNFRHMQRPLRIWDIKEMSPTWRKNSRNLMQGHNKGKECEIKAMMRVYNMNLGHGQ